MRTRLMLSLVVLVMSANAFGWGRGCFRPFGGFFASLFRGDCGYSCGGGGYYQGNMCGGYYAPSCGNIAQNCPNCPPGSTNPIVPPVDPKNIDEITPPKEIGRTFFFLKGIPEGARVVIDGKDYTRPGPAPEYRVFKTPVLKPGRYKTTFVVEYETKDGMLATGTKTISYNQTRTVHLATNQFAFEQVALDRSRVKDTVVAKRAAGSATFEWDVPKGSEVYLDGREVERTGEAMRLTTPKLDPAKRYAFDVTVKHPVDGSMVEVRKTVTFGAGDYLVMGVPIADPNLLQVVHVDRGDIQNQIAKN